MIEPTEDLIRWVLRIALQLGLAFLILFLGRRMATWSRRRLRPILVNAKLSPSMITLATTVTYYAVWLIVIMAALVALGVPLDTVLLVAVAVLVVLGIALQQSLRDIAATVNFILFKHFEPGDLIETNGVLGTVQEIELLNTTILCADRRFAVLPNGKIQENGLHNYSKIGTLRVDLVFSISYEDDLGRAEAGHQAGTSRGPSHLGQPRPYDRCAGAGRQRR